MAVLTVQEKREVEKLATKIRIGILEAIHARGSGHLGGSYSIADVLAVLYGKVMKYDPADPQLEDRDKLVCSKGHAGPAIYATLAAEGFIPWEELKTLNQPRTHLPSHCDRLMTPGIDATTGSLGQGTSEAVGLALADRIKGLDSRTFLIVGDGESNEGQVWEAAMFTAGKKLTNLVWILDDNKKQLDGYTKDILEPFDFRAKFEAFGFDAYRIAGDDYEGLYEILTKKAEERPIAIVLDSVKGRGLEELENIMANHSVAPSDEQCERWFAELNARYEALSKED